MRVLTTGLVRRRTPALAAKGIPKERIRSYGFAFEGKKVLIGWRIKIKKF